VPLSNLYALQRQTSHYVLCYLESNADSKKLTNSPVLRVIRSLKYTFHDAYSIQFADEVLARLDRLLDMGIGHTSILLGSSSTGYVDGARSKMLC